MAAVKIKNVRLSRFAIHLWLLYEDDEFRRRIKLTVTDESPYRTEETSGVSCLSLIKIEVFFGIPSDALS